MNQAQPNNRSGEIPVRKALPAPRSEFGFFDTINGLSKAIEASIGVNLDLTAVADLPTSFLESTEQYFILSIKDYETGDTNNILFLTAEKAYLYSKTLPSTEEYKPFTRVYGRPFGRSTVLTFLILNKVLDTHKKRLDAIVASMKGMEQQFDSKKYRELFFDLERLNDASEEYNELILRLQQRGYKQVETRYISFDYSVLIAEGASVLERCQRRLSMLRELSRDNELRVTTELNLRIEKLNDVVRRLTAITVILMIPTLIASHFGMNFVFMPELRLPWAYPTVIGVQLVLVIAGIVVFRKIGWF